MPSSDTSLMFYGMWHLAGKTVQASIGGLDCGDYTVAADGSIEVPFQSDEQQLMTPAYLVGLDGYAGENVATASFYLDDVLHTVRIPVFIGLGYTSQGQGMRPASADETGVRLANALGRTRRSHWCAALLQNSMKISFGTDFNELDEAVLTREDGVTAWPQAQLYSGVYRGIIEDKYSYDSMLAWQIDRPWPATVCAVSSMLKADE